MQEMYAFAMACYLEGFWRFDLEVDFMAQPPFDEEGHPFDILHYTFGQDYDEAGKFTPGKIGFWHWDKRDYAGRPPPKRSEPPPDGTNGLTVRLIEMVNEATGSIECWEEYRTSGKVHYKVGEPVQIASAPRVSVRCVGRFPTWSVTLDKPVSPSPAIEELP